MDEASEHYIQFLEAGEDTAESFQPPEQSLDLITPPVHNLVVFPRLNPVGLGRDYRNETKVQRQLPCFIPLVGAIHYQMNWPTGLAQAAEQLAPLRRIVSLPGGQRKRYSRSSIRGNHMNLGGPPTSGSTDGLGAVFFNAPVPSG